MASSRRIRGFERAGALPATRLGLPPRRGRELILAQAWEQAAGEALARRTVGLTANRGVLEVEVEDGPWRRTFLELLPLLAARVARARPELGLRGCRLKRAGGGRPDPALPLAAVEPGRAADSPRAEASPPTVEDHRGVEERLGEVARRYLERAADQNQ